MLRLKKFFWLALLICLPFQLGKHFWPPFSSVMGMKIDYLAPTIYLTDILLVLVFVITLASKKSKRSVRHLSVQYCLFFLFLILIASNIFWAHSPLIALFGWVKLARIALAAWLVKKEKKLVMRLLPTATMFWVAVQLVAVLGQWWRQESLGGWWWWLGERGNSVSLPGTAKISLGGTLKLRPYGTFSHPNSLAGFFAVVLVLVDQLFPRWRWRKIVFGAGILILLLTFSRLAWLAILGHFLFSRRSSAKITAVKAILLAAATSLLFVFLPNPLSFSERSELIWTGTKMFLSHPIFGVGWDNFILMLPKFWQFSRQAKIVLQPVHNVAVLILSQGGLLIGVLMAMWWLKLARKMRLTGWVILFLGMADHYWLTLPQNMFLLGLVIGLYA